MEQQRRIYLDNGATTQMRQEVLDAMMEYFSGNYANPSGTYNMANAAKVAIDQGAERIAAAIGADRKEIYFTGSGTESINWAIKCNAQANKDAGLGSHIITTVVEHHAVLHTCQYLEKNGFDVTYLPVDKYGMVTADEVAAAITPQTILVSVMLANNEIGTIMPIAEIGEVLRNHTNITFHTDAVQGLGRVSIDVDKLGVDLLSITAHKLYGPKGVGALYVRRGTKLPSFIHGGGQERRRRAGTENVAGIVGFGVAAELAVAEMESENARLTKMRDDFIAKILAKVPHSRLNGHSTSRLPGNINLIFEFIEGEGMLLLLDAHGISASSGSACTSGTLDPSHVIMALGTPHEMAHGSLRLTLGRYNTQADLDKALEVLPPIVERLRNMSPLWEDYQNNSRS